MEECMWQGKARGLLWRLGHFVCSKAFRAWSEGVLEQQHSREVAQQALLHWTQTQLSEVRH